ncbi:MAG: rhomboid family intramembrane serine protease [Ginsengibacter sp.]|jgi:membrane associated rhomboid family serine protease
MGESDRYLERKIQKLTLGDDNNSLMALIAINVMIFVSLGLIQVIYYMSQSTGSAFEYEILRWVILPAKASTFATMPWTILSYMFVYTGFVYTLINMLWLWAFGSILQQVIGNRQIIPLYIYGGLAGAVFFIAANYIFPQLRNEVEYASLFGGGAAIMAIATGTTFIAPNYRLFRMLNGGISLWVISLVFIFIDLLGTPSLGQRIAHIGGGLAGLAFAYSLEKGTDCSKWMVQLYTWFINLFNPEKHQSNTDIKNKLFYNTGGKVPFSKQGHITQERIDQILDKINQKGFKSLTTEEKDILQKAKEVDL